MNARYLNSNFAEKHLIRHPLLRDWKGFEFFILGEFIIRTRKYQDDKYRSILHVLAQSELNMGREESAQFVSMYLLDVHNEFQQFTSFKERFKNESMLISAIRIYREYGSDGIRILQERRFINRNVVLVERLFALQESTVFDFNERLKKKLNELGPHRVLAECGVLLIKKRAYFGANLTKDHLFFMWLLSVALDPEDYASRYLATKSESDLERVYLSFVRKTGGVHQSMVKLTREVRSALRHYN